jgi:serine/threonine-protein phosphatase 6 regulatory subunit 1
LVEPEPEEEEEKGGRFQLLDRLFKFVRTKGKPLNPVLAGYFSKLMTLLINRKSKNLIPYVFAENSDIIECLVYHVYQKSISELLNKFLNIMVHDFEEPVAK